MIDARIVQRLATSTPGVVDESNDLSLRFSAGGKAFAWTWMERTAPRKPRRARMDVLVVRCTLATKEMLLAAAPDRFFDEPHYHGYPAILARLDVIDEAELAALLDEACRLVSAG